MALLKELMEDCSSLRIMPGFMPDLYSACTRELEWLSQCEMIV